MKKFLDHHFLLNNKTAERLYHDYAKEMPIIDYHCHLPPAPIASDHCFNNLSEIWLHGDHYKWRAMRANGVAEHFITGAADDRQKFQKWAETVPYTLRNPLHHWTHLELQRYFDIHDMLDGKSSEAIYEACNAKLRTPEYSVRNLLKKMNVQVVCTTDDPVDSLEYHRQLREQESGIKVYPAFRPDAAMQTGNPLLFNNYVKKLEQSSGLTIRSYDQYLDALKSRHDFFAENGCSVSDHGLEEMVAESFTESEIRLIFKKLLDGHLPDVLEQKKIKSALLLQLAEWGYEKSWVQQFHIGAIRNNNERMAASLGADTGWDSIGNAQPAKSLAAFLNQLDSRNKLAKTILYNLNPSDNELMATMIGNFNDGSIAGKIQWGSAWWFLDQKDGITNQLNTLSNMGLLSRFVGMITDSRSFLSYPRHEYFRRILCNLFGDEIEKGELPNDIEWTGKIIRDICYNNAADYFGWDKC